MTLSPSWRQWWNLLRAARDDRERAAVAQRFCAEARNHPAFLAPVAFNIDKMGPDGRPLSMWPTPFHCEWLDAAVYRWRHGGGMVLLLAARGHAKSEYYSSVLPAWLLGQNPRLRILHITSADDLAGMYSRRVQEVVSSRAYRNVFPDFPGLVPGAKAVHRWYLDIENQRDPTWRCAGVGTSVTGGRADVIILDDIVTRNNSMTQGGRDGIVGTYQSTWRPMLVPGGLVLVIGTRYYRGDFYGTLIEGGAKPLLYPAEDAAGTLLWPERFTREYLNQQKEPPEGSLASYASQYLCEPMSTEGEVFRREWFPIVPRTAPLQEVWWVWDTAVTEHTHADFSAGVLVGLGSDRNIYVLDVVRGQWSPEVAQSRIVQAWRIAHNRWGAKLRGIVVEDSPSGRVLQRWVRADLPAVKVEFARTEGMSKYARAAAVLPVCEGEQVALLQGAWNEAFIAELLEFTPDARQKWDDQTDAFVYGVAKLFRLSFRGGSQSRYRVVGGGGG